MDKKECEICEKMVKEKYKHYKMWQILAIIFMCLTVLFAVLFFVNEQPKNSVSANKCVTIEQESAISIAVISYAVVVVEKHACSFLSVHTAKESHKI